jgi:hypothetical protein
VPKTDLFYSDDYAPVAERIRMFYERHPAGQIHTQLVSQRDGEITFTAYVYRAPRDRRPSATGWASERLGDGDVNTVACLENTETSAIGRALANLGFTASRHRPSAEEMAKVARARGRELVMTTGGTQPARTALVREPSPAAIEANRLQIQANELSETLNLLATAESYGMRRVRVDRIREQLIVGAVPAEGQRRIRQLLRDWLAKQRRRRADEARSAPTPSDASG